MELIAYIGILGMLLVCLCYSAEKKGSKVASFGFEVGGIIAVTASIIYFALVLLQLL